MNMNESDKFSSLLLEQANKVAYDPKYNPRRALAIANLADKALKEAVGQSVHKRFQAKEPRVHHFDTIVKEADAVPSPRALKRAMRQTEINGISIKTQEVLATAGITKLDQVLIKGTERVDRDFLETIPGIGKTRIAELQTFAAKCFEI